MNIQVLALDYDRRSEPESDTTPEEYIERHGLTPRQVTIARKAVERIRAYVRHNQEVRRDEFEGPNASELVRSQLPHASPRTRRHVEALAIKLASREDIIQDLRYGGERVVDEDTEAEIRHRYDNEHISQRELAADYDVSRTTISKVVRRIGCYSDEDAE